VGVALALAIAAAAQEPRPEAAPPTIVVDFVVENLKGEPIGDLKPKEVEVVQEGRVEVQASFAAGERLGQYRLSYVPTSGKPGMVMLRLLRLGTRARGLDGPALKPRVVPGATPLELALLSLRERRPNADELPARLAALRFEAAPDGVHYALAVEVPFRALQFSKNGLRYEAELQLLVDVKTAEGRLVQRYSLARPLEAGYEAQLASYQLIWTGDLHLPAGSYVMQALVHDPNSSRGAVRELAFEAPAARAGLLASSVVLMRPSNATLVRNGREDDPLSLAGSALMPALELALPVGAEAMLQFYVVLYPDAARADDVSLRVELLRDGNVVGGTNVTLPPRNERGEIRYLGRMPTKSFRVAAYTLRLVAQQGDATAITEAPFAVIPEPAAPVLRIQPVR
jgi:hypothetical protein